MKVDFALFFKTHHSLVRKVIFQIAGRKLSAAGLEDLVQESFVRMWKGLDDFRNDAQVTSWIYRIATNVALDALRSGKRLKEDSVTELPEQVEERAGPDSQAATKDIVSQGLASLSEDHRTVLVLALIHDRPLSEISEILNVPEGTVKSRLHSAKTAFLKFLESKGVAAND
jgi:RNA polymerase sigma-70 factor, ECF subfamily